MIVSNPTEFRENIRPGALVSYVTVSMIRRVEYVISVPGHSNHYSGIYMNMAAAWYGFVATKEGGWIPYPSDTGKLDQAGLTYISRDLNDFIFNMPTHLIIGLGRELNMFLDAIHDYNNRRF